MEGILVPREDSLKGFCTETFRKLGKLLREELCSWSQRGSAVSEQMDFIFHTFGGKQVIITK